MTTYITVAIPYVNAAPHLGYAFELVDADVAARARRVLGDDVRFCGGTDEYSLKNVLAAEAAGRSTPEFVDAHATRFVELAETLDISFDDFIRTSRDPRHRPAVERLWRACATAGDLYRRDYEGHYCVGCEQFFAIDDLDDGRCPEHQTRVEVVVETNWFFRLSRYQQQLTELIESGRLLVEPEPYRNEILAFIRGGLDDISVSRSSTRAHGWGIPVPDDPDQVVYVWFDALTNYISALGYGDGHDDHDRWWRDADSRVHVVGKGITRFHAVYWPAFLLSAGEPVPTHIHVHPYLTRNGTKLSKSSGVSTPAGGDVSPTELVAAYGVDALRWWLTAEPSATADTDFTIERLVARSDADLANGVGNVVRRVTTLLDRCEPAEASDAVALAAAADLRRRTAIALAGFDRRTAIALVTDAVDAVNQHLEATEPWKLARDPGRRDELDWLLATYRSTLGDIVAATGIIVPELAERAAAHLRLADERPVVQPRRATP